MFVPLRPISVPLVASAAMSQKTAEISGQESDGQALQTGALCSRRRR
jgi:hypothetical protein